MSHFLASLFKARRRSKGDLDRLLARYGAQCTLHHEDVTLLRDGPEGALKPRLELESDRMRNALISVEETEPSAR